MSTRIDSLPGPAMELPAVPAALGEGVAVRPQRYGRSGAANDTLSTRMVSRPAADCPRQAQGPNLSISAWYAISGTAMA